MPDLPRSLAPGESLPVLLLIKDAHLFPIRLHNVTVLVGDGSTGWPDSFFGIVGSAEKLVPKWEFTWSV